MRIFVHIGTGKTGTSSIQAHLLAQRAALARAGICVPGSKNWHPDEEIRVNHCDFIRKRWDREGRERLVEEVAHGWMHGFPGTATRRDVVVSCEGFNPRHIPFISSLVSRCGAEIYVVIYVRPQPAYVESSWRQWGCKTVGALEEWVRILEHRGQCDWEERIRPWADEFGSSAVIVRPFEASQLVGGTVVEDFCAALEFPSHCLPSRVETGEMRNRSLHPDLVQIMSLSRHILRNQNDNRMTRLFRENLGNWVDSATGQPYDFVSPELYKRIVAAYEESNLSVARRYLGRETLFVEEPPVGDEWNSWPELTWERCVPVLLELVMSLAERERE